MTDQETRRQDAMNVHVRNDDIELKITMVDDEVISIVEWLGVLFFVCLLILVCICAGFLFASFVKV